MMLNLDWVSHRIIWQLRILCKYNKELTNYYGRTIYGISETNQKIRDLILAQQPFMVGRLGNTELYTMVAYQKECKNIFFKKRINKRLVKHAGFFPDETAEVKKFVKLMEKACEEVDLLGTWTHYMEDYIVNKYCKKDCWYGRLAGLEPWYSEDEPWSELLKGKRVVFVHPFEDTIKKQWEVRDKLFLSNKMLPEFDLRIVKAVQTIAGNPDKRFSSWFGALDYMYHEVMKEDFDIAIIGCGAYGFPLAAQIKKAGKSAIHLGGATQLFMGIKGNRWDNKPKISRYYNEYWTKPLPEDTPENSNQVEKGCYW